MRGQRETVTKVIYRLAHKRKCVFRDVRRISKFCDESDFQKERKWYILSKNSQFEECSIVPLDINGSLAGISDFGEDIVSEAGIASGGISSHDWVAKTTRTVIIIRNPRSYQQFLHPSTEKKL